ncbi:hypothetical protein HG535_0A00250 [Zygotorulaspora mrakii]|uniref:Uncharacterized protein n=1 Tax=Zygotorulaspora mrakii TaxID=42260 RepID=A0A7H9AV19_ZYGMR|nr:uncharacterized protein HG535_0A00250 [Zygotorulaspora mrakii]QLG70085.1 hypothetical protein HG535_0A00250 [Zygotorulaspora mrakii]
MGRKSEKRIAKSKDYRKKNKKALSPKDVKKTKIQIHKMNRDDSLTSDIFNVDKYNTRVRETPSNIKALNAKVLQKDQQKDKEVQDRIIAQRKDMSDNLTKQIEELSVFSL